MKEFNINNYLRKSLLSIVPYQSAREEVSFKNKNIVFLDANENPYQNELNRYPDPFQLELKKKIALIKKVNVNSIFLANGSDDVLGLLINAFCEPVIDSIIVLPPTFGMYEVLAKINNVNVKKIPLNNEFQLDIKSILNSVDSNIKMIFITTPNNPTGNIVSAEDIQALLETGVMVVLDETYYEFCKLTHLNLLSSNTNLVILRTFSKWAGLAGLRIGFGIMDEELVNIIMAMKPPYNVSLAAEIALLASLEDQQLLMSKVDLIVSERIRMFTLLEEIKEIKLYPSVANFILCEFKNGKGKEIYDNLCKKGIYLRYFAKPPLDDSIRISIGLPEHNDIVIAEIKTILNRS